MPVSSPLKWHGGKSYLVKKIVELMPPHLHYVEPYFGSGAVLLDKDPEGVSEVAGDLNEQLTNFWEVLKWDTPFQEFSRLMQATPFSESVWQEEKVHLEWKCSAPKPCVRCAAAFFVACRQSLAGRMDSFAPLSKTRTRRGMNEQASAWLSAVEGLPQVHRRMIRVAIRCKPAVEVIRQEDGPDTLHYLDPPYIHEARTSHQVYDHEMTRTDHIALLAQIKHCKGKVMLSGYPNELYDRELKEWTRHTFDLPNNAAGGDEKRRMTEVLWCNF